MVSALFAIVALTLTVICFRWKDILLSYATALTWLAFGFWWILGGGYVLGDPWVDIFVYVPFIMFFVVMLRLMNTETTWEAEERGVRTKYTTFGAAPRLKRPPSKYESYKKELLSRTRR